MRKRKLCLKPQCLPPPCLNPSYPEHHRSWDSATPALGSCPGAEAQTASSPQSTRLNSEGNQRRGVTQSVTILTLSRLLDYQHLLYCCHSAVNRHSFTGQQTIIFYMVQFANILTPLQGIFFPQNSHLFEKRELIEYILAFFLTTVLHFIYF